LTFGILYESTFATGPEMMVEATPPVAEEYERVHFIGHALWNPTLTAEQLKAQAESIQADLQSKSGYRVFLVDIAIQQHPPFTTDVDFILDVPVASPIGPLAIVAIIAALAVILAFIVWLFWTTYVEKVKEYYCDQETPPTRFDGWLAYVAHLAEFHPTKYNAIQESKTKNWWEEIPSTIKWIVGGVVGVTALTVVIALLPKGQGGGRY